jgi:hypothetical protein
MGQQAATNFTRVLPSRIRTIMIVTASVALILSLGRSVFTYLYFHRDVILLAMGLFLFLGVVVIVPLVWIEAYLYQKKKGVLYQWRNPPRARRPISAAELASPARLSAEAAALRKAYGEGWSFRKRQRSRLFETATQSDNVSRATLLLTVAEKLERKGRRDAAMGCYRQIVQRFPETDQARDATVRLTRR